MRTDNLIDLLINLELRFGGYADNIPRRTVSPKDPRPPEKIASGGMIGGDRMSPDYHDYAPAYADHLADKITAGRPVTVIEFGVLRGTGLAIWSELLPPGSRIIGFDIDLSHFTEARPALESAGAFVKNPVEVYELDQMVDTAARLGDILKNDRADIVIDDGCHFDDAIMTTLLSAWPWLADDFVYFIEDNPRVHDRIRAAFPGVSVDHRGQITVLSGRTFRQWINKATGYVVNFDAPRTWCEKINWKKIHDRNPLLTVTADKYAARKYVSDTLGLESVLKPLIWHGTDPAAIPWDDLPDDYVIKPNHLSGAFRFVRGGLPAADRPAVEKQCRAWLARDYAPFALEWAYRDVPPRILVEALLDNKPHSFKIHVFRGVPRHVQVNAGGVEDKNARTFTFYTPAWEKMDVEKYDRFPAGDIDRPDQLDDMLAMASMLAAPFDYVRVDFALAGHRIYFEEMTHYPTSGHATVCPVSFDAAWGGLWELRPNYWEKIR